MSGVVRGRMQPRLLILANAGSGKTHELVTRCIKLLSLGQKPGEILALTFTRKAAAEFLQKLFERLGDAAANDSARKALARDLGINALTRDQCLGWMRDVLEVMPKLSMGTMDQFFGRIVRSFPFELGMARDFELLDDAGRQENLGRTLDLLFRDSAGNEAGLRELVELLRRNSRDRSDSSALRALQEDITGMHEQIAGPSKNVAWGDEKQIWKAPNSCAFLAAQPLSVAAEAFWREVESTQGDQLTAGFRAYLEQVVALAKNRAPGAGLGAKLGKLVEYLGKEWKLIKKDNAKFLRFGNHGRLRQEGNLVALCEAFRSSLIKTELRSRLDSSAALYQLLRRYDELYEQTVRGTGAITFADVTEILTGHSGELKDDIAYRLDSRHKHWLLDEFQDTSRSQWEVIEPLVSEVLMDSGDDRSFFYVGDTKQSIYGWRGGDDRLFREIYRHYNRNKKDHIEEAKLDSSWRSDRAILEVVNEVFSDKTVSDHADDFGFPSAVVDRWRDGWVPHKEREGGAGPGYVRLCDLTAGSDEDADDVIDRELVRLIATEIKPIERGLSCAVLTRTGGTAEHYANVLEKAGIKAVTEGRFEACRSNPQNLALLAAVRCVDSPADSIAAAHFIASPFGREWRTAGAEGLSRFRAAALESAASRGFAATVRGWIKDEQGQPLVDPAAVSAFIDAAAEFDAVRKPGDDWRTFINHLEHYTLQENESPGVVRVMTIHKAKGLGMDVVILPELGGHQSLSQLKTSGISLVRDDEGKVLWGLDLPSAEICAADPELNRVRENLKANQTFGELCVFYVAMTRAKHAIYCLTAERQERKNAARWLMRSFPAGVEGDAVREVGDKDWFRHVAPRIPEESVLIEGHGIKQTARVSAAAPSSHKGDDIPAGLILGGGEARHLGTEVHELLAQVEWLGDEPDFNGASAGAIRLVREFLASDRASILKKPRAHCLLWRERAFDVEVNGHAVSGVFDRVHIELDEKNQPVGATIYDFKTDKDTADLRGRYADQLKSYAAAAARLLDLPEDKVRAEPVGIRGA